MGKSKRNIKIDKKKTAILVVSLICVFAVLTGVLSAVFSTGNKTAYRFSGDIMNGIDVSSHNGKIDWDEASSEIDFAFIRAGYRGYAEGNIEPDKRLKKNLRGANENGVPVGVYFYSQAINENEAVEEAEFVIKEIKKYDIGLPVVIDFEYAQDKSGKHIGRLFEAGLNKKENADIINAFCERVEKAGYSSAVYASSYFFESVIDTEALNNSITIWVADYNKELTYSGDFDVWQYTNRGDCKGVSSKYVDLNRWYVKK